ncbi:MAG TPA: glycosyltransferase family 2 protein [Steroidobacteraceae bacterium]|nr:glycosyltransferase family 2 protein [Steroidobacteraceae bacterium]
MMHSGVCIVIVSFRSADLTVDCLRSVAQERRAPGPGIRAIVVDNASGDFPLIAKAVEDNGWSSWVTVVLAPTNGGFAYGNNLGVRLALERHPADYYLLLNPDTQVRPGAIAALAGFLDSHAEVGVAGSSFENPDGSEWPIAFRFPTLISEFCSALDLGPVTRMLGRWRVAREMSQTAQPVDWICGASMMIRPQVLRAIGGFDESYFLYFEETDFCLRAQRAGFPTWYVPASRVMHVAGQSTGVTVRNVRPRRLPQYWFESRRRYYALAFGVGYAMTSDLLVLLAYPIGWIKRLILGRSQTSVPCFWRDLLRNSLLWRRNRLFAPVRATAMQPVSAHSGADVVLASSART